MVYYTTNDILKKRNQHPEDVNIFEEIHNEVNNYIHIHWPRKLRMIDIAPNTRFRILRSAIKKVTGSTVVCRTQLLDVLDSIPDVKLKAQARLYFA